VQGERLGGRDRIALAVQRAVGRIVSPLWVPVTVGLMRFGLGWTIADVEETRRVYRVFCDSRGPRLICANHLTLVDSALIAWALGSPGWFLRHYAALPWNVPERDNFAFSSLSRLAAYVMKCVPITRGGDRRDVGRVLARVTHLLARGESVLIFPEGGRSRSGTVDLESAAYGVGRIIAALPDCRVFCVYLRGEGQHDYGDRPAAGERFHVYVDTIRPRSELHGMRRARDLARQVVRRLADLEQRHFAEAG